MEGVLLISVIGQDDSVKATIRSRPGKASDVLAVLAADRCAGPGVLEDKAEICIPASAEKVLQPDEGPFKYFLQKPYAYGRLRLAQGSV